MLFQEGAYIAINQERCLNHQHNDIGCNHCVTLCPGEALQVRDNKLDFNHNKCLGCGVCFSNCPTEVFSAKLYDETTIINKVIDKGAAITQLFCEYHPKPFLNGEEVEKSAIQIPTCLGSISKGTWYEIGLHTKVELRLENCALCPMESCSNRLMYSVNTAIEWLIASGHPADFSSIFNVGNITERKKLKASSTGIKVTSRRDLFLSLFKMGKNTLEKVREQDLSTRDKRKKRTGSLLPKWKKNLEKVYTEHFQEGGVPAYWPTIAKKNTCVNCGLCAKNCPAHTLEIIVEYEKAIHTFTSGHCLDCRMCQLFCPTESIIRDREVIIHPFESKIVSEIPVTRCIDCGNYTVDNPEHLCYWCENEPLEADVIADVWKHFKF